MSSDSNAPLLIELGCEEIPAAAAPTMAQALLERLTALLDEAELTYGQTRWMGTPRRLVAHIDAVQVQQPDRTEEVTGPPAKVAFQSCGTATRAGEGFARGQGMTAEDLYTVTTPKGDYAALKRQITGRSAAEIVGEALQGILRGLPQPKKMRWLAGTDAFIRPVRWLVALLGDAVIEAEFAGCAAGTMSRGHRFFCDETVAVTADLAGYLATLRTAGVEPDHGQRQAQILKGAQQLASSVGGELVADEGTLATTTWLVEQALPLVSRFDDAYLAIPDPVILTTLKSHQKLFCVRGADGALMPYFIGVANTLTDANRAEVGSGNNKVVAARRSDARFFHVEDGKQPLASYNGKLSGRVWLQQLGTVADKVARVTALTTALGKRLGTANMSAATRGAQLCKADLSTRMVGEFPSLQGVIGGDYARRSGESGDVAEVIEQHYLPRFSGDKLPATDAAAIVAVADRLDSICGCFGVGLTPTGAQDPYALRRAALGVLHILADRGWQLGLGELLGLAIEGFGEQLSTDKAALKRDLLAFFRGRLKAWHQQEQPTDIVDAVLAAGFDDVTTVAPRIEALAELRGTEAFEPLAITFKRVGNIVAKAEGDVAQSPDPGLFVESAEQHLHSALETISAGTDGLVKQQQYTEALGMLSNLRPAVDRFFDDVMVMAEQDDLRRNRLALMHVTGNVFAPIADFRRIQGKK